MPCVIESNPLQQLDSGFAIITVIGRASVLSRIGGLNVRKPRIGKTRAWQSLVISRYRFPRFSAATKALKGILPPAGEMLYYNITSKEIWAGLQIGLDLVY